MAKDSGASKAVAEKALKSSIDEVIKTLKKGNEEKALKSFYPCNYQDTEERQQGSS